MSLMEHTRQTEGYSSASIEDVPLSRRIRVAGRSHVGMLTTGSMVTKRPAHLGGGRTGIAPAAHRLPRQFWVDQYWPEAGHIGRGLLDTRDWADPDLSPDRRSAQLPRLHVVTDGEVSAHSRRKAFAHAVAATQARSSVRAVAALGSVATVFVTAAATLIWAFLAIPNTPLP